MVVYKDMSLQSCACCILNVQLVRIYVSVL